MEQFIWSLKNGDLEALTATVEHSNIDLNTAIGAYGRYPLHFAADFGQTSAVRYLISKGAQVNVQDKHGITPLLAAIFEGHLDTAKLLLDSGADKNGKAPDGSSYADCAEDSEMKALLQ